MLVILTLFMGWRMGLMSLAGMMIKNAIVLLDEVNNNVSAGQSQYDSVVEAAVSRLRPVVPAAATTVFGVVPLLQDVFWVGMGSPSWRVSRLAPF